MAKVTAAEELVNEICGQSFTGTIPDGVKMATKLLARYYMWEQQKEDDYLEEVPSSYSIIEKKVRSALARHIVKKDYTTSLTLFDMNDLRG